VLSDVALIHPVVRGPLPIATPQFAGSSEPNASTGDDHAGTVREGVDDGDPEGHRVVRSARTYQQEAEQLRARGWTYRQIAVEWRSRYGFNTRVAYRLAHGMTQADVARRWNDEWPDLDAPKTAKQISYWEIWPRSGGRTPSMDTLNKLAYLYRCSAGELLDGEDYSHLDLAITAQTGGDPPLPTV
jgi:hypothetical protein